jgi:hypothetical protein
MKFLNKAVRGVGKAVQGVGKAVKSTLRGTKRSVSPGGGQSAFAGAVAKAIKDAPVSSAGGTAGTAGKASDVVEKAAPAVASAKEALGQMKFKKGGAVSKRSSSSTSARGQGAVMKKKRAPKNC